MFWKHECTRPRVYDYDFGLLPDEVKDSLTVKGLKDGKLKRCNYCDDIWIETRDYNYSPPPLITTVVGIEDMVTKKMVWKILGNETKNK